MEPTTARALRSSISVLLACGVGCLGVASVLAAYEPAPAAARANAASATVITVTAGKPSELAFSLSRSSVLPWTPNTPSGKVTFKVTNDGALAHSFKICTSPVTRANANTCDGTGTKLLRPGQSATLTVGFKRRGIYEYLSTVAGQAARGMKGLIGVGVKPATAPAAPATTTTTTTTTTAATAPSSLVGNANSGKLVFGSAGCASCHTLAAAGASGTTGPSLDLLKPTQPVIVQYVTNGSSASGSPMPAYAGTLTPTQIDDLAAYVYLTTHTIN